jgi:hypothetical protein
MDVTCKTPELNGKAEHWHKWSKTFLCRAALSGYKKTILDKEGDELDWAKNEWQI